VKYVINEDGTVKAVANEMPTGTDSEVASCVFDVFRKLRFQPSNGGNVSVLCTLEFGP